jgi:hypothetical protein
MEISGRAQAPVTLPIGKELSVANGDKCLLHSPTATHKLNWLCEQKTCA